MTRVTHFCSPLTLTPLSNKLTPTQKAFLSLIFHQLIWNKDKEEGEKKENMTKHKNKVPCRTFITHFKWHIAEHTSWNEPRNFTVGCTESKKPLELLAVMLHDGKLPIKALAMKKESIHTLIQDKFSAVRLLSLTTSGLLVFLVRLKAFQFNYPDFCVI